MTTRTLKKGFTTGAAAAAAAKACLMFLVSGIPPGKTRIRFLTGEHRDVDIYKIKQISACQAECRVIKDAGDDPDITHRAEIGVILSLKASTREFEVKITGGKGVGMVTKPGLEVPPGHPAVNPGPIKMIKESLLEVLISHGLGTDTFIEVEIFVPEGEVLAQKTLNQRLGITGGISILGTTGIVTPMSHDAYIASIKANISVARAMGTDTLVFTTGRRSERFAMALFPDIIKEGFIQIGDFFKDSLDSALAEKGICSVTLTMFFGKAVKMAMGFPHTHAAKSALTLERLSRWAHAITQDKDLACNIRDANTARQAFGLIHPCHPAVISHIGRKIIASADRFSGNQLTIRCVILDFNGRPVIDMNRAQE